MVTDDEWSENSLTLRSLVREFPRDLVAGLVIALLTSIVVAVPQLESSILRFVLGALFLTTVPGYTLLAALFVRSRDNRTESLNSPQIESSQSDSLSPLARIVFSIALSVATAVLWGMVLNFSPLSISLWPVVIGLNVFVVLTALAAAYRRLLIPPSERFRVPFRAIPTAVIREFNPGSTKELMVNAILLVSLVVLVASIGYTLTVPGPNERFTEFYLASSEEGNASMSGYPSELEVNHTHEFTVGVVNQEFRTSEYTTVVLLQRVQPNGTGSGSTPTTVSVVEKQRVDEFSVSVAHGESIQRTVTVEPGLTGQRLRLAFLLFEGPPPENPSLRNAYRETHLWINVSSARANSSKE